LFSLLAERGARLTRAGRFSAPVGVKPAGWRHHNYLLHCKTNIIRDDTIIVIEKNDRKAMAIRYVFGSSLCLTPNLKYTSLNFIDSIKTSVKISPIIRQ
jgi:hypothetical protein